MKMSIFTPSSAYYVLWQKRMLHEEQLERRLRALPVEALQVFGAAAVTHSLQAVLRHEGVTSVQHTDYRFANELLYSFWNRYPHSLGDVRLHQECNRILDAAIGVDPDERFLEAQGAEHLLWGAANASSIGTSEDSPLELAESCAFDAYKAVFDVVNGKEWFRGREFYLNWQEELEKEASRPELVEEVQFQAFVLAFVEKPEGRIPDYEVIVAKFPG